MKKIIRLLILTFLFFLLIIPVNATENKPVLYLFYGNGCPHCKVELKFLNEYKDDVTIIKKEVWYDSENQFLLEKVKEAYNIDKNGVPLTIIGNSYFLGFSDSIQHKIERAIDYYIDKGSIDQVSLIAEGKLENEIIDEFNKLEEENNKKLIIDIPLIGKVDLKEISISSAAVLIGLIDGFNPCAMWVLLFLISMLLGIKDKKRMWILGLTFLVTSALVYMLIMFSWLNIVINISSSVIIRYLIGLIAIFGGVINLRSFYKTQNSGCSIVNDKKRKKIFHKIRKFTQEKSLVLALGGIMLLAVSVNIVELACSAGLPFVFTQVLAVNNISGISGLFYTSLYVIFFLLDDIVVFAIAMITMNITGISTKYNKYSHLVGGIIMLVIGLLLIFKYELLTFGF